MEYLFGMFGFIPMNFDRADFMRIKLSCGCERFERGDIFSSFYFVK